MKKQFRRSILAICLAAALGMSVMPVYAAESIGEAVEDFSAALSSSVASQSEEEYAERYSSADAAWKTTADVLTETEPEQSGPVEEHPETAVTEEAVQQETAEEVTATEETDAAKGETEKTVAEEKEAEEAETEEAEAEKTEAVEAEAEEELLTEPPLPSVSYQTHVQTYGWQKYVKDGALSGTHGESKRLEGIRIKVDGVEGLGVEYRTHVQTYGWQDYVKDDAMAGTSGEAKRLEAINIRLTGEHAEDYDIYYCVHVQTFGWLGWAKNGEMAGTAGYAKRLEGIRICIQKKGEAAPALTGSCAVPALYAPIEYQTHVQTYGWQGYVTDGAIAGTTGQSKRLEGIRIRLGDCCVPGSVRYRTHVQTYGWESSYVKDDAVSGTSGQSKRLEAIEIALEGEIANYYDVYYRTHVQRFGWTGWAKNGAPCGSEGLSFRLEGIQIRLVPKGNAAPGNTDNTLYTYTPAQNEMINRAQSFYSATDWLILTNVTTHIVGVFHWNGVYWGLYKEFLSSTGAPWSPTVEGEFIVQAKILYFGDGTYRCWYATQFWGDYLFHSVLYNVADGPYTVQDGRLGMAISHGCVRMQLQDAKWIYDNIPSGTKVYVYH